MTPLLVSVAMRHLLARKRQSLVSLMGIVLGVGFFLAISAMMQGSEADFIRRLVDNSPHITLQDTYRNPTAQPVAQAYPNAVIGIRRVKPETETRGIRGYARILDAIRARPGLRASAVLTGQALINFAGRDVAVTLNGIVPSEYTGVSTIENYMVAGTLEDLNSNQDGIIIGDQLAHDLSLERNENISVTGTANQTRTFKIVGLFHTGRLNVDSSQAFVQRKRVQALMDRANRVNSIIVKANDPYVARDEAARIEQRFGYKSVSWQEASEDIMNTLMIRNIIMYTVVSAVLIVAAFGIYNVISTVVLEKQRDVAILKSIGFRARDIEWIFLLQGVILGTLGNLMGLPLGSLMMASLGGLEFKLPGSSDVVRLPIDWSWQQFAIAGGFALFAAVLAAFLPARKAARLRPVDILRGGT
jgi:lipoprotein-releasing system permease protein